MNRILPIVAALTGALLSGCASNAVESAVIETAPAEELEQTEDATLDEPMFDGDLAPDQVLAANADYTTVNDDEWSSTDAVSGTTTITEAGVYTFSGSLAEQVVVAAPEDALVVLILDGVDISSETGPAIEVQSADDVAIYLAAGSENTVSDAAPDTDDATAAIDAKADLTISGEGSLTVNGNSNDGIASTDDLVILSGDIEVTAVDDALRGKDALVVEGGSLSLAAEEGDGMKSDHDSDETKGYILVTGGTIDITAGDDGLQAQTDTVITGGTVNVAAVDDGIKGDTTVSIGGGDITVSESTEGIEAVNIGIFAGKIDITASDDGINASGNAETASEADTGERLEISGGEVTITAGSDGLDSNGSITITGGIVDITAADRGGDGPIDANGAVSVAEGTVIANGTAVDPATAGQTSGGPGQPQGGPEGEMPGGQAPSGF